MAAVNQVTKQAQDFIAAASGRPGESLGTILGDIVKRRRDNAEKIVSKSHLILLDIGVKAGEIPFNVFQPALEAASVQEDEYLQDTWGAFLANAADPRKLVEVTPAYVSILRDFGVREVKFLDALYSYSLSKSVGFASLPEAQRVARVRHLHGHLMIIYANSGLTRCQTIYPLNQGQIEKGGEDLAADRNEFTLTLESTMRHNIVARETSPEPLDLSSLVDSAGGSVGYPPRTISLKTKEFFHFTAFGGSFVRACRKPAKVAA